MSFRRRTYSEIIDNLLTHIVGGVAAEEHPFPPSGIKEAEEYSQALQKPPVAEIVSLYGMRNGKTYLFTKDKDYVLDADKQTLKWLKQADWPDKGTVFHVNYRTRDFKADISDIHVGSVVRTLSETVGLEIARAYAELEAVYQAGFIDSAAGKALDKVVALLGIKRVPAGRNTCEIEFARVAGTRGNIYIPAGTRVMTEDGDVEYEITESVTMLDKQTIIRVTARDMEQNSAELSADSLTVLVKPIAGIKSITNQGPSSAYLKPESDTGLRTRAKNFLHGSERATLGAIRSAVARQGVLADYSENSPGIVTITPHAQTLAPELIQRINTAIADVRPAGVKVELDLGSMTAPARIDLQLSLTTDATLLEQDIRAAQQELKDKIIQYFANLPVKEAGSINQIIGMGLSIPEIQDLKILSASVTKSDASTENVLDYASGELLIEGTPTVLGDLQIADPNLPTLLNLVIKYTGETAPAQTAIESALQTMLTYINDRISSADAVQNANAMQLSLGKLLYVLPLPVTGKPQGTLAQYDQAVATGSPPILPGAADIQPWSVQFVFTHASGLSRIIAADADPPYTPAPYERISLAGVEIVLESE